MNKNDRLVVPQQAHHKPTGEAYTDMRSPNLNALRMFDAAARHSNFRLAAEEMNLTQGAVAQQVRALEAELGIKLFERVARGLVLTPSGKDYHSEIRQALAMDAAANGQGIALAPRLFLTSKRSREGLAEVWRSTQPEESAFYILHPPADRPNAKAVAKLVEWLLREAAQASQDWEI